MELQSHSGLPVEKSGVSGNASSEQKQRRPIPAYTQFLREQYKRMKDHGVSSLLQLCHIRKRNHLQNVPKRFQNYGMIYQSKRNNHILYLVILNLYYRIDFEEKWMLLIRKGILIKGLGWNLFIQNCLWVWFHNLLYLLIHLWEKWWFVESPFCLWIIIVRCGSSDIYHSYPSNNLFRSPYTHQGLSDPSLATLNIMPDSI